jgi:hypothetical protein
MVRISDFPWCGFLINMCDLSVSADYTRYAGTREWLLIATEGRFDWLTGVLQTLVTRCRWTEGAGQAQRLPTKCCSTSSASLSAASYVFMPSMPLTRMAKHKSHVIFCDTTLNTERVVHRNVYQNFLLAAMKMHCYVRDWGVDLGKRGVRKFLLGERFPFIPSISPWWLARLLN